MAQLQQTLLRQIGRANEQFGLIDGRLGGAAEAEADESVGPLLAPASLVRA